MAASGGVMNSMMLKMTMVVVHHRDHANPQLVGRAGHARSDVAADVWATSQNAEVTTSVNATPTNARMIVADNRLREVMLVVGATDRALNGVRQSA